MAENTTNPETPISGEDKALWNEMEHTKHGREFYEHAGDNPPHHKDHSSQEHTVHGNEAGDPVPHIQHDGPDDLGDERFKDGKAGERIDSDIYK